MSELLKLLLGMAIAGGIVAAAIFLWRSYRRTVAGEERTKWRICFFISVTLGLSFAALIHPWWLMILFLIPVSATFGYFTPAIYQLWLRVHRPKMICAWCLCELDRGAIFAPKEISHGICASCRMTLRKSAHGLETEV